MPEPWTGSEIASALESGSRELASYFRSIPEPVFFSGDDKAWGPAHHLAHVTRPHSRIGSALRNPSVLPAHASGRSRTYSEIRDTYRTGLVAAAPQLATSNPIPPVVEPGATREGLADAYAAEAERLRAALADWSEEQLDARAMRHPILGFLTTREMLFFIHIHDRHHLDNVRGKLSAPEH